MVVDTNTLSVVTDGPLQPRPFVVDQQSTDTESSDGLLLLLLLHRSGHAR